MIQPWKPLTMFATRLVLHARLRSRRRVGAKRRGTAAARAEGALGPCWLRGRFSPLTLRLPKATPTWTRAWELLQTGRRGRSRQPPHLLLSAARRPSSPCGPPPPPPSAAGHVAGPQRQASTLRDRRVDSTWRGRARTGGHVVFYLEPGAAPSRS